MDLVLEILKFTIPAIVVGVISYLLIKQFLDNQIALKELELRKKNTELISPQKLQAYERLALFLERIKPINLARREDVEGLNSKQYEYLLIKTIQDEWEHNTSQQIYIHPETWKIIHSAKAATQSIIKDACEGLNEETSALEIKNKIIKASFNEMAPSDKALLRMQIDLQGNV